jgi:hypothetical protein
MPSTVRCPYSRTASPNRRWFRGSGAADADGPWGARAMVGMASAAVPLRRSGRRHREVWRASRRSAKLITTPFRSLISPYRLPYAAFFWGVCPPHSHTFRTIPTFVARMSQTVWDACTTLYLVNVLQEVSHICGPRATLARPMPRRGEGAEESNDTGIPR